MAKVLHLAVMLFLVFASTSPAAGLTAPNIVNATILAPVSKHAVITPRHNHNTSQGLPPSPESDLYMNVFSGPNCTGTRHTFPHLAYDLGYVTAGDFHSIYLDRDLEGNERLTWYKKVCGDPWSVTSPGDYKPKHCMRFAGGFVPVCLMLWKNQ